MRKLIADLAATVVLAVTLLSLAAACAGLLSR
jgi:hypothetical protein